MIDTAMRSKNMRLVKMNVILRVLFPFYMTSRPSSMGPFCKEYADLGYYLKLRNLRIYRRSRLVWTIAINFRNYKGNNSFLTKEQTFYLESVTRPHNLTFCVVTWMMTYLYAINAFKKKFESLRALFDCEDGEVELDEDVDEWACFPAIKQGGREFIEFTRPATAVAISASTGSLCKMSGLATVGNYAVRRDTGDKFNLMFDEATARMVMAHETDSIFRNHYSKETETVDVVGARIGEAEGVKVQ
ncbi:uncharacterized protein EV420DRAFT_589675 [Desarmillaria tabescens]|uniref:Uncharacterized protein n=1 Tax=Armillaria tabescens TaxID=1929756 RepID=A0AA39N282_ARMTA|nr:uncharacterized protein EV420DRAFT_589675 [Desarmillaria tabescens]KAK0455237.1 hypothetical protein EV420DRAFT_589675 [Desarmillaria tabescens]